MPYKDKDKQKKANRLAKQRQRQGMTKGMTEQGMTSTSPVIPRRGKDITKFEHLPPDIQQIIDRISESDEEHARRTAIAINYQHVFPDRFGPNETIVTDHDFCMMMAQAKPGHIRVSKPGDEDYIPLCETTRAWAANRVPPEGS